MNGDEPVLRARVEGRAEVAFVDAVLDALERIWSRAEVADADRMLFGLAVSEIATNVVTHSPGDAEVRVTAELEVGRTALTAIIRDTAWPVDIAWADVSMPGPDAESGRGLALAREALDVLDHHVDHGNVWTLVRRLA
ncbi:ATP-binding protein [Microbacterium sp. KNMS]